MSDTDTQTTETTDLADVREAVEHLHGLAPTLDPDNRAALRRVLAHVRESLPTLTEPPEETMTVRRSRLTVGAVIDLDGIERQFPARGVADELLRQVENAIGAIPGITPTGHTGVTYLRPGQAS